MISIVDYGVGNLFSLKCSFSSIGEDVKITGNANEIKDSDKIILPGVGAFEDASKKLFSSGLAELLLSESEKGKPIMGICLGMQLLFDQSFEYGCHKGLGLIKGDIEYIGDYIDKGLKIPHIGWNSLSMKKESPIFKYVSDGDFVYFVHSYFANCESDFITATSDYSYPLTASVQNKNVFGCQFHPEKSGKTGLSILKAFSEIKEEDLC